MGRLGYLTILAGLLVALGPHAIVSWAAEEESTTAKPGRAAAKQNAAEKNNSSVLSAEEESLALSFVAEHHPELTAVLAKLKERRADEYQSAIAEIHQTAVELGRLKEKDEARFALDLKDWTLKSRAELLAARLRRAPDAKLEAQLKELLAAQIDVQVESRQLMKKRMERRLSRLDEELKRLADERAAVVETRFRRLVQEKAKRKNKVADTKTAAPAVTEAKAVGR